MPKIGNVSYTVRLKDYDGKYVAEIEPSERMYYVKRYNMPDILEITVGKEYIGLIGFGQWLEVWRNDMRLASVFPVRISREYSKETDRLIISCRSPLHLLRHRVIYPRPDGNFSTDPDAKDYYTVSGSAEAVIKDLVDKNIGPGALLERRFPGLTIAPNKDLGAQTSASERFSELYKIVTGIATASDLRIIFDDLQMDVEEISDKSASILFSPDIGNVQSFTYEAALPEATSVIMRGDGDNAGSDIDVYVTHTSEEEAEFWRIEAFRNARGTNLTQGEVLGQAKEWLQSKRKSLNVNIEPGYYSGKNATFREPFVDFDAGDIVSVTIDGVNTPIRVQEISFLWRAGEPDDTGEGRERVTFGEWGDGVYRLFPLRPQMNDIIERLSVMESKA